uniref:AB hydrolase-1 domain-containing protein n=1 Tax=Chenopodium quinoa TaxID=63459 RepID=A0A803KYK1_CHEQI
MEGEIQYKWIKTNGIKMHIAEQGTGPLVLLLHGFPEFWYSWRHQIPVLASHGYHVVAPDLRGYGDSDSPLSPSSYSMLHIVADLVGLLDYFGEPKIESLFPDLLSAYNNLTGKVYLYLACFSQNLVILEKAFVAGTDWGAEAAWHLSLFRPDRVKGVVCLSVPFFLRDPNNKPTDFFRRIFGDDFYVCQFQETGRAERAFARYDYLTVMKKYLLVDRTDNLVAPEGMEMIDYLETPSVLPPWITEEELQVYADKFQESGFTGPLNYYRAMDLNWELLAAWQGAKITVPGKFIIGNKDIGFVNLGIREYIEGPIFKSLIPNLQVAILNGHHYIQLEKPQDVSNEILSFLQDNSSDQ